MSGCMKSLLQVQNGLQITRNHRLTCRKGQVWQRKMKITTDYSWLNGDTILGACQLLFGASAPDSSRRLALPFSREPSRRLTRPKLIKLRCVSLGWSGSHPQQTNGTHKIVLRNNLKGVLNITRSFVSRRDWWLVLTKGKWQSAPHQRLFPAVTTRAVYKHAKL